MTAAQRYHHSISRMVRSDAVYLMAALQIPNDIANFSFLLSSSEVSPICSWMLVAFPPPHMLTAHALGLSLYYGRRW
jgi:hypothetical protein